MSKTIDKIEDVQELLAGIIKDLNTVCNMAKIAVPMVEGVVERGINRVHQIEKLFSDEETNDGRRNA